MNRRHYLGLSGSIAVAGLSGCTGDPSGIISSDDEGNESGSGSVVPDSGPEPIETTFEGTGSGFHEITIENDGMTFFRIETEEEITVSLINSENEPLKLGVDYPSAFTRVGVHTISEEYALEIEAEDDISWSVTVEDQPRYTEDDVGETDFPIEISGNSENIFGPFNLNGFHQPRVRTNVQIELIFANQTGEVIERVSTELDDNENMTESFVNLDSVNISEVCWIWCSLSSLFTAIALEEGQGVSYDVQIVEPDNS
jgi:hypothetical protein